MNPFDWLVRFLFQGSELVPCELKVALWRKVILKARPVDDKFLLISGAQIPRGDQFDAIFAGPYEQATYLLFLWFFFQRSGEEKFLASVKLLKRLWSVGRMPIYGWNR